MNLIESDVIIWNWRGTAMIKHRDHSL